MPLSQSDPSLDYGGSWGDASIHWPYMSFKTEDIANHAYYIGHKFAKVPYGCYVLVDCILRLEDSKYIKQVKEALALHPYIENWKNKIKNE